MDYQRVFLANPIAGIAIYALILAGCGGGGGPVDPNVGRTPAWTQACGTPETLFPPRSLSTLAYDLGIISSIAADSELVFFATDRAVFRVPTAGGEPELLVPEASAYFIDKVWQVGGRYLATRMYGGRTISVLELPRAGTALNTVIDSIPVLPEEYKYGLIKVFWIDENYVYWQATRPFTQDGKDLAAYPLHRMSWHGDGRVENLAELTATLSGAWKQGETLWILDYPGTYDSLGVPRLLSLPAAGGTLSYRMNLAKGEWLLYGDETSLYFQVINRNSAYSLGLGRLPTRPGAAMEYLFSGYTWGVWPESDRIVVSEYGLIDSNPSPTTQDFGERLWTIPRAGGAPVPVGCLAHDTGFVEARAKSGKDVYLAFFAEETKSSGIAKFTLP